MIWLVFALMTAATLAVLLWPLRRAAAPLPNRIAYDLAVYRAQLAEIDADVGRGLLAPDQADGARLEIQRRMLAVNGDVAPAGTGNARRTLAAVTLIVVPLGAGLLYAAHGRPDLKGQPYAWRLEHDPAVILAHAADTMEAELAATPSVAGYRRLAGLYLKQGDFERAAAAAKRAIHLGADDGADWAAFGEITVLAGGGAVTPDALAAFARALELDPHEPRARYYAGFAEAEIGNLKRAVAIWRDLEQDSKPGAPWLALLQRQIATAAKAGRFDPASVAPSRPSSATLNAAVAAMNKTMNR